MTGDNDVQFRLLHTSDWHLGFRYPSVENELDRKQLMRQRLAVVADLLGVAERYRADAVICAGDIFETRNPSKLWWRALADCLSEMSRSCPVVLLPGNHDYLAPDSVWASSHPFRAALPDHVHVVDRDDWTLDVGGDLRLYARPLRSDAGGEDPVLALPARAEEDPRFRVAVAHGNALRFGGQRAPDFPVASDAGAARDFDYVALGDFHGWHEVASADPRGLGLMHYPGSPEPQRFGEDDAGSVAVVGLRANGAPLVRREAVGRWRWRQVTCTRIDEVRELLDAPDLRQTVLRLTLDLAVNLDEKRALDQLLATLQGSDVQAGAAGLVERIDDRGVRFVADAFDGELPGDVPLSLRSVHRRLRTELREARDDDDASRVAVAEQALSQLMRLLAERRAERMEGLT